MLSQSARSIIGTFIFLNDYILNVSLPPLVFMKVTVITKNGCPRDIILGQQLNYTVK